MQEDKKKPDTSHSTSHLVISESEQSNVEKADSAQPTLSGKPELGNWKWSEDTPTEKEINPASPSSDLVETEPESNGEAESVSPVVSPVEPTEDQEPEKEEPSAEEGKATPSDSEEGDTSPDSLSQQQVDPKVIEEASQVDEQDDQADEWEEDDEPVRRPIGKLKWSQDDEAPLDTTAPIAVAAEAVQDAPSSTPEPSQSTADKVEDEPKDISQKSGSGAKWVKQTLLFLPLVWVIVLAVGLMIGYGVMGDQPPGEVFNPDLWKHLYDLIYG
ncbi:hypothetical protein JIR001_30210 [Polycladomyces abyssicola]|uniref:DNA-directed RNA polymerase subunit beta n=1 Tax=Polycladomyces abyssicola TaxID=1125966 RepID=A0A8D5ZQE3_9BACL|nr:DNA-directed RNA polymerase subunit beta [Polycladomyces abyssicola]BCU83238.1 hypothetical protein JIR001_30210 [Polycladomyces abyssicola]